MPRKPKILAERFLAKLEEYLECLEMGLDQISLEQIVDESLSQERDKRVQELMYMVSPEWRREEANIIKKFLGVDIHNPDKAIRSNISVIGTPGEPSEGGGIAEIYSTGKEGIYLRIVKYRNPKVGTRYDFITNIDLKI